MAKPSQSFCEGEELGSTFRSAVEGPSSDHHHVSEDQMLVDTPKASRSSIEEEKTALPSSDTNAMNLWPVDLGDQTDEGEDKDVRKITDESIPQPGEKAPDDFTWSLSLSDEPVQADAPVNTAPADPSRGSVFYEKEFVAPDQPEWVRDILSQSPRSDVPPTVISRDLESPSVSPMHLTGPTLASSHEYSDDILDSAKPPSDMPEEVGSKYFEPVPSVVPHQPSFEMMDRSIEELHPYPTKALSYEMACLDDLELNLDDGNAPDVRSFADEMDGGIPLSTRPATWPPPAEASFIEVFYLSCFHLAYGFIFGSMGLCILPLEAVHLAPQSTSLALGVMLGICGLSQLICPVVGKISDLWRSETVYGRRRPFLITGCILALVGVIMMLISSQHLESFFCFNVSLFVGMVGLNTIFSVQAGLAPDLLVESNIDSVSAIVAANGLVGSSLGFFVIMATTHLDYHFVYPVYVILAFSTVFLTHRVCIGIQSRMEREGRIEGHPMEMTYMNPDEQTPSTIPLRRADWPVCPYVYAECTWASLSSSFKIDKSKNEDFYWVFVSRTCYYIGVSVQTFVQPFLRDVAMVATEAEQRFKLASIALTAQSIAAVVAIFMGQYVKTTNVSKRKLIYLAATCMCLVYVAFMLVPIMNPYGFEWLMLISPLYGFGNGCFLSVDYAVAIAVIEKSQAAEMLGVWGVSSFVGAAIGPMVFGVLIEVFGGKAISEVTQGGIQHYLQRQQSTSTTYDYQGYFVMLATGMASTALAGYLIKRIKTPI